jgi:hypothetical protein
MDAVWPNAAVEESNLTVQISALRRALDADRSGASSIQTVPGRGYRFALPVTFADAVERNGDPLGDGVDIAARPKEIAQPGGPSVSRVVSEQVANKLSVEWTNIGEQQLKNIPAPAHAVELAPGTQERVPGKIGAAERRAAAPGRTWPVAVVAASVAALAVAAAFYLALSGGSPNSSAATCAITV